MRQSRTRKAAPSSADRFERELNRLLAAQRQQLKNEDTVRLGKHGELIRESVRTFAVPAQEAAKGAALPYDAPPNNFPETPTSQENGNVFAAQSDLPTATDSAAESQQDQPGTPLASGGCGSPTGTADAPEDSISFHEPVQAGREIAQTIPDDSADPLEELLARALARSRRGRPAAFDERNKGQLIALLSLGMSLRQAASVLGVSHTTIRNTLQADATLAEEITAARFQAQLQPLACVIREARRSWKAATWLLKYLDNKIATQEETPEECRARQQRESDEFFARARARPGGCGSRSEPRLG